MTNIDMVGDGIPGLGSDAAMERRPGVPMEKDPPQPAGLAHWDEPHRQRDPGPTVILRRKGLEQLTPVFGDTIPPKGLSGLIRRAAYEVPEHFTSHWFLLLLSDRIDAIEHSSVRALPIALPVLVGGLVALGLRERARRRRSPWERLRRLF
ncbi:MAG: hypothetical protein JWP97_1576 [Labilithrix sp.]|nr:hypothetical protein [Labilithrix sp.]